MSAPLSRSSNMSISTVSSNPRQPSSHRMQRQDSGYESVRSSSRRSRKSPSTRPSNASLKRRPRASTTTTTTTTTTTATATSPNISSSASTPMSFTTTISHRYSASQTCFSYTFPSVSPTSSPQAWNHNTPPLSTRTSSPSSPQESWQASHMSASNSTLPSPSTRQSVDQSLSPLFPFAPIDLARLRDGADNKYLYDEEDQDDEEARDADGDEKEGHAMGGQGQREPPSATTHYWTSDRTRRLEYAEIDAASRGVAGWLRRRLRISLPACFTGREKHLAFDDDRGSVRRYRLALDGE